jgi:hypothetical protein
VNPPDVVDELTVGGGSLPPGQRPAGFIVLQRTAVDVAHYYTWLLFEVGCEEGVLRSGCRVGEDGGTG